MELPESDSLINVHHFQDSVDLVTVHYHIIQMKDCYFLWIGTSDCSFNSMAMAITTKYDKMPTGTNVIGDPTDMTSQSLAKKLSKKTGKQVFVSCNLPENFHQFSNVEQRIFEELKRHPEKF